MINLGSKRIRDLLKCSQNPQQFLKVFHVAGTNGKGSVCTYLESILSLSGKTTGKFTSPHLITPNDSIHIKGKPIPTNEYEQLGDYYRNLSERNHIDATEFEIQTAVAFKAFAENKVDVAIVEVGLGGREDATNVLQAPNVLCSLITKVSVDHENFLGSDLKSIAFHKAGIIKPQVPCIIDGSNDNQVLNIAMEECAKCHSPLIVAQSRKREDESLFRLQNQAVAIQSIKAVYPNMADTIISEGIRQALWPGRLQWINDRLLVDGAHNIDAAIQLRKYIDKQNLPVRWILAFSKPAERIIDILVRPGDEIFITEFGPVEHMPWIKPYSASAICDYFAKKGIYAQRIKSNEWLEKHAPDKLTVVGGSLYLVGQFLNAVKQQHQ